LKRLDRLIPLFEEALKRRENQLGRQHPEPLLVKGYEGLKSREKPIPKQGGGELRIPEALDRLFELYTALHKPDEAKKWRAERAKYPEAKKPETKK
jgi:hypothetical protein